MTPEVLFGYSSPLVLIGWAALVLFPLSPNWAQRVAGTAIPAILSLGYTAIVLAFWWDAPGGFDSLRNVMALFTNPWIALAGWLHYLAFDLFVGAWIARTARTEGIPHAVVLPIIVPTFLFGPAGLILFQLTRAAFRISPLRSKEP